jgi:hypothetical protein
MKKLFITLFIALSLILPVQGSADITKFGGFLPCTSDNGTLCTTPRYISTPGITVTTSATYSFLTASKPVFTDASKALTSTGTVPIDQGGTGQTTAAAAFTALKQSATESATGVAELATVTEAATGTDTSRITTPQGAAAAIAIHKNPLSFAQGIYLTSSASVTGLTIADNANLEIGPYDVAIWWVGSIPDWTPAGDVILLRKWQDNSNQYAFYVIPTGRMTFYAAKTGGTTITATLSSTPSLIDGTEHSFLVVIARETAGVAGSVKFYVDGQLFESVAIPAGTPADFSNTGTLEILSSGTTRYEGTVRSAGLMNRAPSASDALSLYRNGIDYADKWGSQANEFDTLDTDIDTWGVNQADSGDDAADRTTFLTNYSGAFMSADCTDISVASGVLTFAGAIGAYMYFDGVISPAFRNYELTLNITSMTGQWYVRQRTNNSAGNIQTLTTGKNVIRFTTSGTGTNRIYLTNTSGGNNTIVWDASAVSNFLHPIGATLALESEGIQRDGWKDSSTNGLNAAYPASGYSFLRPIRTDCADGLLSVTNVSLGADADTTVYTVPVGKRLVITKAILVVGADAGTSVISIGADGAETDWIPNNTLSALDAANDAAILMPVPNTTPTLVKSYAGGTVIQAKVSSHAGGATNTLFLYGFLY